MEYQRPPTLWEMLRGTLLWVALLAGLLLFATAPTEPTPPVDRMGSGDSSRRIDDGGDSSIVNPPVYARGALADSTHGPRTKSPCVRALEIAAMDTTDTIFTLWVRQCVKPRLDSLRAIPVPPVRMH